jgi:iron-sulfur cluster repair protein YtfE (RIC family)
MLVQVGRRTASEDVVDLLAECHGRIRRFVGMARSLANAPPEATAAEISATAAQVRRYFAEGLPLHVEDEEVEIGPHLPEAVAKRVHAEHGSHEPFVAELIRACHELEQDPASLRVHAEALGTTVRQLAAELESHLVFEETFVFPEIRQFERARKQAIRDAMRARREREIARGLRSRD